MNPQLSACAQSGDVAGAEEIIQRMQGSKFTIQRTSVNFLLKACAKSADGQAAERWFAQMVQWGLAPNRASYCGVILAWVKGGNLDRSEHWICKLYASGFTTPKGFCRQLVRKSMNGTSKDMLTQCAEQVTLWLGRLHRIGVPIDRPTVNLLMGAFARNGNLVRTEQWAAFMQEAGISPNRSTFCALVTASQRAKDHERANKWLARMEELGFTPGDLDTDRELGQLGDGDSESGDYDDTPTHTPPSRNSPKQAPATSPIQRPATAQTQVAPPSRSPALVQEAARPQALAVQAKPDITPAESRLTPKKINVPACLGMLEPAQSPSPIRNLISGGSRLQDDIAKVYGSSYFSSLADPVHVWPMVAQ